MFIFQAFDKNLHLSNSREATSVWFNDQALPVIVNFKSRYTNTKDLSYYSRFLKKKLESGIQGIRVLKYPVKIRDFCYRQ